MPDDLPVILFASAAELEAWLEAEHGQSDGIWLKIAKKDSGVESVSYAEAVELGLCFGWIDGQARRFDDRHYLQRFTPRRAAEQVVAPQPRAGRGADRRRPDAARPGSPRSRRPGPTGAGTRPMSLRARPRSRPTSSAS